MDFAKGAIMGIIAGTVVGVMNSSNIIEMFQQGKRIIGSKERFESNKDALISSPIIQLLIVILWITQKKK